MVVGHEIEREQFRHADFFVQPRNRQCRVPAFILALSIAGVVFAAIKAVGEPAAWQDWRLWLLCSAGGSMIFISTVLVAASCSIAPLSLIWTITNLAPLVPVAAGILLFNERLTAGVGIALALFCGMVALFARGVGRAGDIRTGKAWTVAIACAAILATNGLWLVCTKVKERLFDGAFSAQFMLVCYGTAALCSVLWYVKRHGRTRLHAVEWAAGGCAGAASAAGTLLLLGAMSLPSAVVFPVSTGLSLVIGVALGAVLFHERMNAGKVAAIFLGCAAVILVLLFAH